MPLGSKLKYELDGLRWKSSVCDNGSGEGPPPGIFMMIAPGHSQGGIAGVAWLQYVCPAVVAGGDLQSG
ncbi:hypothetical protein OEZ86_010126 [Tetradesmus obliquus]|nr:hypothetical protein OEZ86_010126 [Tetradesmus obliquus]